VVEDNQHMAVITGSARYAMVSIPVNNKWRQNYLAK
jgi:hypothetical protein